MLKSELEQLAKAGFYFVMLVHPDVADDIHGALRTGALLRMSLFSLRFHSTSRMTPVNASFELYYRFSHIFLMLVHRDSPADRLMILQ